ncbi:MAG: TolA-binding protein [Kiritimatiellia bacterium]|jgi:TolA-binding protein
MMRFICSLLVVWLASTSLGFSADWRWQLSADRYKQLNAFERALYDKGRTAFEQREYRAAATAFEKFKVEHEESPLLPYVIFMQGRSLHEAKDRGKAIRAYNEVLDYFGDVIDDAAPALYYLGVAHLDNGDKKDGILAMKEMVEDEDYSVHPLAAGALARLADNYWANQDKTLAVKYWKQVVVDFSDSNAEQSTKSRNAVILYYVEEGRIAEITPWLMNDVEESERVKRRADIAADVASVVLDAFRTNPTYHQEKYKAAKAKQAGELWTWLSGEKASFTASKQEWKYLKNAVHLTGAYLKKKQAVDPLLNEAQAYIKTLPDEKVRDQRVNEMADFLKDYVGDFDRAFHVIGAHSDPNYVVYKRAEYLLRANKVKEAAEQYKRCESMPDKNLALYALHNRAHIYRERLNMQDEAIKLYQQIAKPPSTLWYIAECYTRKKDHKSALNTWREIENSFPEDAPRAAWNRADYYQKMGENKLAVAEARSLLKRYPTSGESSAAHQLLESYGIDTGGGVQQ